MESKKLIQLILKSLKEKYPNAHCELRYKENWQLLIAIVLSAQTTDKVVNKITPILFDKYKTLKELSNANIGDVEKIIYKSGFFHNKAKNIIALSKAIIEKYNGIIPQDINTLTTLPAIGRKTANVFLGEIYKIPSGIVVDTHVMRLTTKIWKLTNQKTPEKIESDLMKLIPKKDWVFFSFSAVLHGRYICVAKKPKCNECNMKHFCPSYNNIIK